MNTGSQTPAAAVGAAVAATLHSDGNLEHGAFVKGYVVLAAVEHLDGTEQMVWIPSEQLQPSVHRFVVEEMRDELRKP